jgi:hypothetical protein
MKIKNTFPANKKISAAEQRLVFATSPDTDTNSEAPASKNFADYNGDVKAYTRALEKMVQDADIDETEKNSLIADAKNQKNKLDSEQNSKDKGAKLVKKIEAASKKEKSNHKIAKSAIDAKEKGYAENIDDLRQFVRDQIADVVGEKSWEEIEGKDQKVLQAAISFEQEIWTSIEGLLGPDHDTILKTVERDKIKAKRCYLLMREFFEEKNGELNPKLNLLRFLRTKKAIPASVSVDLDKLFEYAQGVEWKDDGTLINIVRTEELTDLELALNSVGMLYDKWSTSIPVEKIQLEKRLEEYEVKLNRFKNQFDTHKRKPELESMLAEKFQASWSEIYSRKKADYEKLQKLLAEGDDEPTRRLISAFLDGNETELSEWDDVLATAAAEEPAIEQDSSGSDDQSSDDDHSEHEHGHDDHGHAHGDTPLENTYRKLTNFFTAGGRVAWYSWYDIEGAFKLLKESWEKHAHSVSEDKRGPLAEGIVFWRPEIERRIQEQDRIAEKGRSDERKKHYINFDYKRLMAELQDRPANDKKRAILEILAERGNLRMSDRTLIEAVCGKVLSEDDWTKADNAADYTKMRETFKAGIDGHGHGTGFIGEIGYAEELLNKQASGLNSSADKGKQLAGSGESVSTSAEINIFDIQRKKSYQLGTEGEYEMAGMLETMVGRGNPYSGGKPSVKIEINEKDKIEKIDSNANMGLVGLMLTDSYLKGALSREFLAGIGKKHESGFNPFSTWSDILAIKSGEAEGGRKVSKFEEWGWIVETKSGRGYITELGKSQLINFFNTRNAQAVVRDANGDITTGQKLVHIAIDCSTYQRHSRRQTSISGACSQTIKVGDKLASYIVKKSTFDLFNNATALAKGGTGAMVGETDQITSLIKSAVEDFIDGMQMAENNERYYDQATQNEISVADGWRHDSDGWRKFEESGETFVPEAQVISYGKERAERGRDHLVRMFENLYLYSEDRSILNKNVGYCTADIDEETKQVIKGHGPRSLRKFLEGNLDKYTNSGEYQDVMQAFRRLESRNIIRKKQEIEKNTDRDVVLQEADQRLHR